MRLGNLHAALVATQHVIDEISNNNVAPPQRLLYNVVSTQGRIYFSLFHMRGNPEYLQKAHEAFTRAARISAFHFAMDFRLQCEIAACYAQGGTINAALQMLKNIITDFGRYYIQINTTSGSRHIMGNCILLAAELMTETNQQSEAIDYITQLMDEEQDDDDHGDHGDNDRAETIKDKESRGQDKKCSSSLRPKELSESNMYLLLGRLHHRAGNAQLRAECNGHAYKIATSYVTHLQHRESTSSSFTTAKQAWLKQSRVWTELGAVLCRCRHFYYAMDAYTESKRLLEEEYGELQHFSNHYAASLARATTVAAVVTAPSDSADAEIDIEKANEEEEEEVEREETYIRLPSDEKHNNATANKITKRSNKIQSFTPTCLDPTRCVCGRPRQCFETFLFFLYSPL